MRSDTIKASLSESALAAATKWSISFFIVISFPAYRGYDWLCASHQSERVARAIRIVPC